MRTFILLSAIPGSGKSTWARTYAEEHPNTFIVASDELRCKIAGSPQAFDHEEEVWDAFLNEINGYADQYEDCTVIADATNLRNQFREFYCKSTPKFDKHILVVFQIPFEICLKQNRMRTRSRIVPDLAMIQMFRTFEKPSEAVMDMYDEVLIIGKSYHSKEVEQQ